MIAKELYEEKNRGVQSVQSSIESNNDVKDDNSEINIEPKVEEQQEEVNKETEQSESKVEETKKEEPKIEEPKIEETQKEEIKKEEIKKTEPKQQENNKNNQIQQNITKNNKVIAIDPGHQIKGDSSKEPIGPGATETKAKVTGGATGVATKQTEYELNLKVALLLQKKLQEKGYTVVMTRTSHNVNISNRERADIANNANAAAFIRIHANSLNNSSVKGILTMCQTANNPYNGNLANASYKLSKSVLDNVIKTTGGINKGVTRTDTMSGINWCKVPTTIIEMGFLSNPEEDRLMATPSYQEKIVDGIVNGIEEFLK
ncbi:MAG: N-acetylmuramoyl-L-alanine amidase [Clostridia bacterium]|nr:N-acetylmuramoyl-L-alanine amidase [Clostridia bacterium]